MSQQETTYYQDTNVLITNARAVLGGKTYAMANITSVATTIQPGNAVPAILVILVGFLTGICSFAGEHGVLWGVLVVGILLFVGGILYITRLRDQYRVTIGSSSGEIHALVSRDKDYITKIVAAMNEAIVKRG